MHAWRNAEAPWDHVLLHTHDENMFMVVVIDHQAVTIHGHHFLNLRKRYGLDEPC